MRELIAIWRELQAEAQRLEEMLRTARDVHSRFLAWARHKLAKDGADFMTAYAARQRLMGEIRDNETSLRALQEQLRDFEMRHKELSGENDRLADENKRHMIVAAQSEAAVARQLLDETARQSRVADASLSMFGETAEIAALARFLSGPDARHLEQERIDPIPVVVGACG